MANNNNHALSSSSQAPEEGMHSFHKKHQSIWQSKLTSITNKCLNKHFGRRLTKWFLWLLIFNSKTSHEPFSTSVEMRKCTLEELCWSGDTWANKLSHYSAGAAAPGEGLMPLRGLFASVLSKWLWENDPEPRPALLPILLTIQGKSGEACVPHFFSGDERINTSIPVLPLIFPKLLTGPRA